MEYKNWKEEVISKTNDYNYCLFSYMNEKNDRKIIYDYLEENKISYKKMKRYDTKRDLCKYHKTWLVWGNQDEYGCCWDCDKRCPKKYKDWSSTDNVYNCHFIKVKDFTKHIIIYNHQIYNSSKKVSRLEQYIRTNWDTLKIDKNHQISSSIK